jgi:hypothetical protein
MFIRYSSRVRLQFVAGLVVISAFPVRLRCYSALRPFRVQNIETPHSEHGTRMVLTRNVIHPFTESFKHVAFMKKVKRPRVLKCRKIERRPTQCTSCASETN